ncbi:MAG: polyketide synthase module [Burkholderiaceae bacterium]|jgi:amino acid adenylation domain-containing protein|nr:MAG: polyketide synthase module [Burkholderiaceae bacterium]
MTERQTAADSEQRPDGGERGAIAASLRDGALIHELFDAQAARAPQRAALRSAGMSVSYAQLNARAQRIACALRARGVGAGDRVGLCVERGTDMVAAMLGILRAGAAYVPLDPSYPRERLCYMADDAGLALLVSTVELSRPFTLARDRQLLLDADAASIDAAPESAQAGGHGSHAEAPAYTIYTSGSTGNPKGVVIPHRAVVNFLRSMAREPGLTPDDVLVAVTTLSFDIAVLELLLPLVLGATVVIAGRDEARDGHALKALLEAHHATVMQATPVTWQLLLDAGWTGGGRFKALVGGEALPPRLAEQLLAHDVQLWNMYGPTETTVWSTCGRITAADNIHIGRPIDNTEILILDEQRQPAPVGTAGEMLIGGAGLSCGYLDRPELTAEKFIAHPVKPGALLYRTGDLARVRPDGNIECLGRLDHQVKIRGHRVELGEIETVLSRAEGVDRAAVVLRETQSGDKRLVAYYTETGASRDALSTDFLRGHLRSTLPDYMVPSVFQRVDAFPLTPNGKIDRKALPDPSRHRPQLAQAYIAPRTTAEKQLAELWCELLQLDRVGIDDSFFDLGGTSLAVVRMTGLYRQRFGHDISPIKVFQHPTIAQLGQFLEGREAPTKLHEQAEQRARDRSGPTSNRSRDAVAIIGMVGRFPGADNLDELWRNLCDAVESISFFTPEELGPGIDPRLRDDPDYVRARGMIDGADQFDAAFFGISPLEARVMDPQQRVFLELAQHALENAGVDPERYKGLIGVYAGIGDNHYYTTNLLTRPDLLALAGKLAVEYGNQKDYIALRTAYLLDLRGPAVSLNTACSTALLAIDQAYRALLDHECDVALAGGIDITVPQKSGFLYQEGGTFARDGHCRPFDADATGTMFCDGAGIVVLKRLRDAMADGDTVYATLIGSGKNNNGARPASFLAPSVEGQAEVIAMAQARAGVPVETIGYIEAHGTGTPVGDPIEIEALRQAFQAKTDKQHFCYLGSIKGNIGHPTNAAGVAGLIKATLALHREQIPATLHFRNLNPKIDLANGPFLIADHLIPFPRGAQPRRAAVSAFGFGGTNVHMILEEAAVAPPVSASRPVQLLPLSARSTVALDALAHSMARSLDGMPPQQFADAAYTLQTGRRQMAQRRFVVATDPSEAAALLRQPNPLLCGSRRCERRDPPVVFMFGGQGTQYVNMGRNLYQGEPLFRAVVDDCCDLLKPYLGRDLRELLYPRSDDEETARTSLQDTFYTQPSIFVIEYALARLWQSLGVQPTMMVGHSIGEFTAATLAGVWDLEDALRIIALRGRLMQALPRGAMLAVGAAAKEVEAVLPASVQLASNNSPSTCVVAGPEPDVASFKSALEARDIVCRHLHTSHAFHSAMMDPMLEQLRAAVAEVKLRAPALPMMSTVTGRPMTAAEAMDPGYWAHHARATVQFSTAAQFLVDDGYDLFLECGPRATLSSLVRQQFSPQRPGTAIPTMGDTHENHAEWKAMLFAVGALWQNGVSLDWEAFYAHEERHHVPLPTYAFERKRYWVDPAPVSSGATAAPMDEASPSSEIVDSERDGEAASAPDRKHRVIARLIEILLPISGLDQGQISASATFLEQGFNSLSLTQVALAVRQAFGVKVTFAQLMNQWPNLELLAAHLDQSLPGDETSESQPAPQPNSPPLPAVAKPEDPTAPLPLPTTAGQQEIWYASKLGGTRAYHQLVEINLHGPLQPALLQAALQELVDRNDALRTTIAADGTRQFVHPARAQDLPLIDLSAVTGEERHRRLHELTDAYRETPFKLSRGPLMKAQLIRLGAHEHILQMVFHHVVIDGWSTHVVAIELSELYSARIEGGPAVAAPAMQYRDYVAWYGSDASIRTREEARRYWTEALADGPAAVDLPTQRPRPAQRSYRARTLEASIDAALLASIKDASAASNATLFQFLLAASMVWLHRITGQRGIVIGVPVAGQLAADLQQMAGCERLLGHSTSLLPVRATIDETRPFAELLSDVKRNLMEARTHEACTYGELVKELDPPCAPGTLPFISVLLNLNDQPAMHWPGLQADIRVPPRSHMVFDLEINMWQRDDGLGVACYFAEDLFHGETVRQWLDQWKALMTSLTRRPVGNVAGQARLGETAVPRASDTVSQRMSIAR